MNRKLVLVSQTEKPDCYGRLWGLGLGNDIYTIELIEGMDPETKMKCLTLGEGDSVMLIGGEAFKYLKQFYHYGIRNENYSDCAKLRRLSLEGGCFAKCIMDFPESEDIADFLSPDFSAHVDFSWFQQKTIHDYQGAISLIDYMDSLPEDTDYGYDYEGSGMPLDRWYELSGASLCTYQFGGFISFTDIRHEVGAESDKYKNLLYRLGQFLIKRQGHIWTYNMQYEFQVSRRMLGVDLFNLCDTSVVNTVTGNHLKKYSLKWSAQKWLQATVWDSDFDRISDLIDSMLFIEEGKLKKDKKKVLRVDQSNFEQTEEWKTLASMYPNYIGEFKSLLLEYWGNPFMCIPSDILGYYCNLDAFYTLMIYLSQKNNFSQECWNVNLDNIRLGARLMSCGLYIDEPYREKYEHYCHEMMAWGITYCAEARCWIKMEKHKSKMADIKKYNPIAVKLLKANKFYGGNANDIAKDILVNHVDTMDAYELGLNEGALLMDFGPDFAVSFVAAVRQSMEECEMIKTYKKTGQKVLKTKIEGNVGGKKKLISLVGEKLIPLLGLNKIKLGNAHQELEKYLYYERAFNELMKVSGSQLNDIKNIPQELYAFGQKWNLLEYSNYVSDNYFKCKSPIENDEIALEFSELYRHQTAYLTAMFESTQQLEGATEFYKNRGITNIDDAFNDFMTQWKAYFSDKNIKVNYPSKAFELAMQFYNNLSDDKVKETWTNFNGYIAQSQFFPEMNNQFEDYGKVFDPADLSENFFAMRKITLNYLLFKKYSKLDSTYVGSEGMFKGNNKWVIEDKDHIPLRVADPGEPGAVEKCFVHYEVQTKSSKRWSSGFHTIISHGDCKDCLTTPYHYDELGNKIDEGFLMTYFDISSAEVKSAGYASGDPDLIEKFNNGTDIYIYSAKLYLGEEGWNKLSKKDQKKWRKRFKTIFLGVLYGLGKNSLAERLNCSIEEAEDIIQGLYKSFPKLREYVASQQDYPMQHGGYINTMLGDKLKVVEYDLWRKATSNYEKKNLEARIKRLGVNLPIQGGTSTIMSCGFFNNIRTSRMEGWDRALQPIITVHDSNTNLLPVEKVFDIRHFYDHNYTDYCASIGPRIKLLFDLLCGDSYERAMEMKQIDENTIGFTGSAYSMLRMYDKIMNFPGIKVECDTKREDLIPNFVENPIQRFILEQGCNMVKDLSKYTVQFKIVR